MVFGFISASHQISTSILQMASYFNYLMREWTEVEMQMNAVERIQFYTEVDREDNSGKLISSFLNLSNFKRVTASSSVISGVRVFTYSRFEPFVQKNVCLSIEWV